VTGGGTGLGSTDKRNLIRFVIRAVFIVNYNGVNLLSNTTIWLTYINIYIYILLHREQLHVSALDNGHYSHRHYIL